MWSSFLLKDNWPDITTVSTPNWCWCWCWCAGVLVCWCWTGVLVFWCSGVLVFWCSGVLVLVLVLVDLGSVAQLALDYIGFTLPPKVLHDAHHCSALSPIAVMLATHLPAIFLLPRHGTARHGTACSRAVADTNARRTKAQRPR